MKEASGELNMTVVTIVAIAAILGFFWAMWPTIKEKINDQWNNVERGNDPTASYIIRN